MGGNDTTQQDQLARQNAAQAAAQAKQDAVNQQVSGAVSPLLSGNVGFSPQMLAALRSSAIDQNAQKYNSAAQATNANLSARGENGMTPISGVGANGYGNLQAAKAGDLADANRTVTLNDAQTANANRLNAASILNGVSASYGGNVGVYGSGASGALNNVTTAQQGGFLNNFTRALGSGIGQAAVGAASGGLGTAVSKVGAGDYGW